MVERRWISADAFLAEVGRRQAAAPVPSYLRADVASPEPPARPAGYRAMAGVPRTARLLDRRQAGEAAELAARIGIGRAAARYQIHRRTLRAAWDAYGIEVEPPGGGRRRPGRGVSGLPPSMKPPAEPQTPPEGVGNQPERSRRHGPA